MRGFVSDVCYGETKNETMDPLEVQLLTVTALYLCCYVVACNRHIYYWDCAKSFGPILYTIQVENYCRYLLKARIVKPTEAAVARERLRKQRPLLGNCRNRQARDNRVTAGSGVFCAVSTEAI
jgi:hypothetical protein